MKMTLLLSLTAIGIAVRLVASVGAYLTGMQQPGCLYADDGRGEYYRIGDAEFGGSGNGRGVSRQITQSVEIQDKSAITVFVADI